MFEIERLIISPMAILEYYKWFYTNFVDNDYDLIECNDMERTF